MNLEPTWRFRRMGGDEPGIDPAQPARPPKGTGGEELFVTGKLVTGDPDFKSVEVEIRLIWLQQIAHQAITGVVGDLPAGMHATGMAD